jgi:predicted amidophosphoribosyltransferase
MPFILDWQALRSVTVVIPAPSSRTRVYQPAHEIALKIAEIIGAHYVEDVLEKLHSVQSKDLSRDDKSQLSGTIHKLKNAVKEHDMLIVDDLFQTGRTLEECVRVLRTDPNIRNIYVLTMTKTRR